MEPNTGAILAMASSPDYDPNQYSQVIDSRSTAELESLAAQYGEDSEEYQSALSLAQQNQWRQQGALRRL